MSKKIDIDKMTRKELEEYAQSLPETRPPNIKNAAWLALFGCAVGVAAYINLTEGNASVNSWLLLGGSVACLAGAAYITYKALTYRNQ